MNVENFIFKKLVFIFALLLFSTGLKANPNSLNLVTENFNSGSGRNESNRFSNTFTLGQPFGYTLKSSPKHILRGGFLNLNSNIDTTPAEIFVYNKSVSCDEDSFSDIILQGSKEFKKFKITTYPKNGIIRGEPPNITYIPSKNFYGNDYFSYTGFINGIETKPAIITVNVRNINDPPLVSVKDSFIGVEDEDLTLSYYEIEDILDISDPDNSLHEIEIYNVNSGKLYLLDKETPAKPFVLKQNDKIVWRPDVDVNGQTSIITIRITDGVDYSQPTVINVNLKSKNDLPYLNKKIENFDIVENSNKIIDITDLFNDPDGNEIEYFIADNSNESLVHADIKTDDKTWFHLKTNENKIGFTEITIGGESEGDLIYHTFELRVTSIEDNLPFIVNTYWKGKYEGDTYIDIKEPQRIWSFESKENITKSISGNWKFSDDTEEPKLNNISMLSVTNNSWDRMFVNNNNSIRIQDETYLTLKIPKVKSGADWAERNNSFTIVFDVKLQGVNYNPILNSNYKKLGAELWVKPNGSIGGQGKYSEISSVIPNSWYRLTYVVDSTEHKVYINENLILVKSLQNSIDSRYSLSDEIFIGLDNFVKNKDYQLRRVVYYDFPLNKNQIEFLGLMSIEEFEIENSRNEALNETVIYIKNLGYDDLGNLQDSKLLLLFNSKESNENWMIEKTTDLKNWENFSIINTQDIINNDLNYKYGEYLIELSEEVKNSFFRIRAME